MGYFAHDAAVPTARRREGSGSRATPPPAEDRSPSHEPLPRRDRGDGHRTRRSSRSRHTSRSGDAGPHPVLVGGVIWTIAARDRPGITWAFVGGLVLDSLLGGHSARRRSPCSLAVGGAAAHRTAVPPPSPRRSRRRRPVLSLVYSDADPRPHRRCAARHRRRRIRPAWSCPARSTTRSSACSSGRSDHAARPPHGHGAGRLVSEPTSTDDRVPERRPVSASSCSASPWSSARAPSTARLFAHAGRRATASTRRWRATTGRSLEAIASTRGLVFDRVGQAARHQRRRPTASRSGPSTCPNQRRDEVVQTLGALIEMRPGRDQHRDRLEPRLALRPRPRRPGRRAEDRRASSPSGRRAAGRPGRRRDAPELRPGLALRAHPRLHRARSTAASSTTCKPEGYLPDDLIGRAGVESTYEDQLRGTYGLQTRRARRLRPRGPGPPHR